MTSLQYDEALSSADQIIAGMNFTRRNVNLRFLHMLGYDDNALPDGRLGEKLICWKNNKQRGVLNGMPISIDPSWPIKHIDKKRFSAWIRPTDEPGTDWIEVAIYRGLLDDTWRQDRNRVNYDAWVYGSGLVQLDWAFCITCHKAQGSEWDDVLFIDDGFAQAGRFKDPILRCKWLYTAITRAAKTLAICGGQ